MRAQQHHEKIDNQSHGHQTYDQVFHVLPSLARKPTYPRHMLKKMSAMIIQITSMSKETPCALVGIQINSGLRSVAACTEKVNVVPWPGWLATVIVP
jgi:hypothetical protein